MTYSFILATSTTAGSAIATDESSLDNEIKVDINVVQQLQDLEFEYTIMLTSTKRIYSTEFNIEDIKFFLDILFKTEDFKKCSTFDQIFRQLERFKLDPLNISLLKNLTRFFRNEKVENILNEYNKKKEVFMADVTVKQFHIAVLARSSPVCPKGMRAIKLTVSEEFASQRTLSDVEKLAKLAFKDHAESLVRFHAVSGSVILMWLFPESLTDVFKQMASTMYKSEGVLEITVSGIKMFPAREEEVREVASYLVQYKL